MRQNLNSMNQLQRRNFLQYQRSQPVLTTNMGENSQMATFEHMDSELLQNDRSKFLRRILNEINFFIGRIKRRLNKFQNQNSMRLGQKERNPFNKEKIIF